MKKYVVYTTEEYDKDFKKLDKSIKIQVENEIEQLEVNPYASKSLGYKFFREKKVKNYRIYFLVYEKHVIVFVIAMSDKKDQQKVINTIKSLIPFYKKMIKEKLGL
jgi:mRNA-degrading endonuclease RelE of RelBE toxin-antitoxin system